MHNIIQHNPGLDREDQAIFRRIEEMESTKRGKKRQEDPVRKNNMNVYFHSETLERLTARIKDPETRSQRVQADLTTYWNMLDIGLAYARRGIKKSEAKAILDILNGTYWDATTVGMMTGGGLTLSIEDGIALESLDKKWGFSGEELVNKLKRMDRLTALSILDWARVFWANCKELDPDEYVKDFQEDSQEDSQEEYQGDE